MYNISIIIVNWNTGHSLKKCLESISKLSRNYYNLSDVIIVDNASTDDSIELIECYLKPNINGNHQYEVKLIRNSINEGFAKACNLGAKYSHSDFILFLNPDMILYENTLDTCFNYINNANIKKLGALGIKLLDEHGITLRTCSRFPKKRYFLAKCLGLNKIVKRWNAFMLEWDHKESRVVDEVIGAFFLVIRKQFEEMMGFDERFFVYYEEVDYCKRLKDKGYYVYYYADATAFHEGGASSSKVKDYRLYYELRSRYQYELKHYGNRSAYITRLLINLEFASRYLHLVFSHRRDEILSLKKGFKMFKEWYSNT